MAGLLLSLLFSLALAAPPEKAKPVPESSEAMVPMRDGVRLAANIFRPAGGGKFPTLLIRTPYNKGGHLIASYLIFIENGYAVVVQDVRGRYASEGGFRPLHQEIADGSDTLTWIAAQPWSDRKIGMLGGSYVGIVQWKAALSGNPHLRAIFPVVAGADEYRDRFYSFGGALKLGHRLLWLAENLRAPGSPKAEFERYTKHLPLRTIDRAATGRVIDFYQAALNHPSFDHYWKAISTRDQLERTRVPAFFVSGWYDNFAQSELEAFSALSQRSGSHRIVVGPWGHNMSIPFRDISYGPESGANIRRYQLDWFDYWLKPQTVPKELPYPPVRLFVMGKNQWRAEKEWPLARTQYTPLYLGSRDDARGSSGNGTLSIEMPGDSAQDTFVYDPARPVPTMGGAVCCNPKIFPWGPMDQRTVEARKDVLVYTSGSLKKELEVTGPVRVALYISTSAPDTDFTAKLVDVHPDGHARNLTDGILRLRYRQSLEKPVLAKPGEVYRIAIDAGVTSNVFLTGHRIRLEVSSSNFPRFDRNLNTGRAIADETEMHVATQTVRYGKKHPSHIVLPVIPAVE